MRHWREKTGTRNPLLRCPDALEQPDFRDLPMAADGFFVYAEQGGDFVVIQTAKEPELYDLRFLRVFGSESVKGFVDLENLFVVNGRFDGRFMQFDAFIAAASFKAQFTTGVFNQDPSHRFTGGAQKVGAVLPHRLVISSETQPGFVDERGGLERLIRPFASHFCRREPA